jgi:cation-transporting ATPase G
MSEVCCGPEGLPIPGERVPSIWQVREIRMALVAGLALAGGLIGVATGAGTIEKALLIVAIVAGGSTFAPGAVRSLLQGRLGVDTLMTIAGVGAIALGEWAEAATLAFLFSISEAFESYAMTRTRQGLRALLDLVPASATVLRDGAQVTVPPQQLQVGDVLLVRPGERLATDGVIRNGSSAVDLSAITGESVPVELGPGTDIYAAAINGGGALEVEVTAGAEDNSLAQIVRIVEEAQGRKGGSQRLAERIAKPLVPGVLVVAAAIALIGSIFGTPEVWLERSLVVLVAAAPCAFAISVPVTVVAAIGAATRSGVLIKGGAALESLGRVGAVALDKTGTLTRNAPSVVEVVAHPGISESRVLASAAALEARSEHPLARAILAASDEIPEATEVEAVTGQGLTGLIGADSVRLGKPGFVAANGLSPDVVRLQEAGATVVLVERGERSIGLIAVRDDLRPEASEAVARLRANGMSEIVMLTGDNRHTAAALASRAGISEVESELLPADKVSAVETIRRHAPVAMVGDGINDAPALASADVGIAMGAIGTDVAIEAADVALMGDDLRHLPDTFTHARSATRIMKQNLALSGGILLTLVPLAAAGALGLAAVVSIHELAEVLVIANGIRAGGRRAFGDYGGERAVNASDVELLPVANP